MTLEGMLQKHDRSVYLLHHWSWAAKSSVTAKQAGRLLKAHMDELLDSAAKRGDATEGLLMMAGQAQAYVNDIWQLSPADFEKLRNTKDEDFMRRVPLDVSGMAPWMQIELKKEGGNLRFQDD